MAKKSGLRLRPDQVFATAGLQTLYSGMVPRGIRWCVQHIAWEINKVTSGGNTRCRLYIDRVAEKFYLDEQLTPVADWLYTHSDDEFLYPGERLALEIDQGQAATTAKLYGSGYREAAEA